MKSTTADLCIDYSFKFLFISINHDLILNSQNQFTRFWGFIQEKFIQIYY